MNRGQGSLISFSCIFRPALVRWRRYIGALVQTGLPKMAVYSLTGNDSSPFHLEPAQPLGRLSDGAAAATPARLRAAQSSNFGVSSSIENGPRCSLTTGWLPRSCGKGSWSRFTDPTVFGALRRLHGVPLSHSGDFEVWWRRKPPEVKMARLRKWAVSSQPLPLKAK